MRDQQQLASRTKRVGAVLIALLALASLLAPFTGVAGVIVLATLFCFAFGAVTGIGLVTF